MLKTLGQSEQHIFLYKIEKLKISSYHFRLQTLKFGRNCCFYKKMYLTKKSFLKFENLICYILIQNKIYYLHPKSSKQSAQYNFRAR